MSRKDEKRERYIKELEGIAALLTKTLKKKEKVILIQEQQDYSATVYCCVPNFEVNLVPLSQFRNDPRHIIPPSLCTRHFSLLHHVQGFSRITLYDTSHNYSPPFSPRSPDIPSNPDPILISPTHFTYQEHCSQTLSPLTKVAYTFGSKVHVRPHLVNTHAPSASIARGQYICD